MKVLMLSPVPPPVGGIASWTLNILSHYSFAGESPVTLIHQNTAMKYRDITKRGFINRLLSGVGDSARTIIVFLFFLFKNKPDVVHITSSASLGIMKDLVIALIAKFSRTPIIIHYRFGRIPEISISNTWEWRVLKIVTYLCSAAIVLDDKSFRVLKSNGFDFIFNIPNPISSEIQEEIIEFIPYENQNNDSQVYVIFVGHVVRNKGVFELVEACSLLGSIDELILIGPYEKDVRDSLLKISSASNLKIKFTGILDKKFVLAEMKQATLLALPSYSEGFPNVIIEAMAMQCPIVATDVGAVSSMLNIGTSKPAGLVVDPKNVAVLAQAISMIVTDKAQTEKFKMNALSKVKEEYTLDKVCEQYEKVWNLARQQ